MMVSSFHDGRSQAIPMAAHVNPYDYDQQQQQHMHRKRKADTQDTNNERLSKRLSLLNLGMFNRLLNALDIIVDAS